MGKYLAQAASPSVLNHAWRLLRNDRGHWSRGVPLAAIQGDAIRYVGELSREMISGRYHAETMRCFQAVKADGGERTLCASAIRDKLAQRAVLIALEPLGEALFHDASFGYRPGCTVDMALALVREWVRRGWSWLADADIRACFDSIPQYGALNALQNLCGDRALVAITQQWLEGVPPEFRPVDARRGLPQGMVLSPFLCNLYLHQLDTALERQGVPFVRFADDFVLLARSEDEAHDFLWVAEKALHSLDLELHPDKTKVIRSDPRYRFLGKRLPDSHPRFRP